MGKTALVFVKVDFDMGFDDSFYRLILDRLGKQSQKSVRLWLFVDVLHDLSTKLFLSVISDRLFIEIFLRAVLADIFKP